MYSPYQFTLGGGYTKRGNYDRPRQRLLVQNSNGPVAVAGSSISRTAYPMSTQPSTSVSSLAAMLRGPNPFLIDSNVVSIGGGEYYRDSLRKQNNPFLKTKMNYQRQLYPAKVAKAQGDDTCATVRNRKSRVKMEDDKERQESGLLNVEESSGDELTLVADTDNDTDTDEEDDRRGFEKDDDGDGDDESTDTEETREERVATPLMDLEVVLKEQEVVKLQSVRGVDIDVKFPVEIDVKIPEPVMLELAW